jgi:hypothetical protein
VFDEKKNENEKRTIIGRRRMKKLSVNNNFSPAIKLETVGLGNQLRQENRSQSVEECK